MGRHFLNGTSHSPSAQALQVKKPDYHHKQVALLIALGWSTKKIAEEMGMIPQQVSIIKTSPAVKPLIEGYRARIEERAIAESMACRLQEEFHTSMDSLAKLRDESLEENVVLSASKFMVEKAVDATIPKKTINEEHKKVGVVLLTSDDVARLGGLMSEIIEVAGDEVESE